MPIFHFQPEERAPGTIIKPGNFKRLLHSLHEALPIKGRVLVTGMLCREMLFEAMRLRDFPELPSRLDCVFVLPTKADADAYAKINNADGRQVLHEVERVDANVSTHTAWLSHCTMRSGGSFLDQMEPKGRSYWTGEKGDASAGREMLVAGTVRIVRRLT